MKDQLKSNLCQAFQKELSETKKFDEERIQALLRLLDVSQLTDDDILRTLSTKNPAIDKKEECDV